jgi:GMP synthase (glutamine-hydrolysing)
MHIIKTGTTLDSLRARRGDFEDWIVAGLGLRADQVNVVDVCQGAALPNYGDVAGVVITGSHAMVTEHSAWSERVAQWLPAAVAQLVPILGICYGHQLLAYALGGLVTNNPLGSEDGTVEIHLLPAAQTDALFAGLPATFQAHASHVQTVMRLPSEATLLACSARDAHHAFAVGRWAWGVQFHPEFDVDIARTYLHAERQELAAQGQDPAALIAGCRETPEAAALLGRFACLAAQR